VVSNDRFPVSRATSSERRIAAANPSKTSARSRSPAIVADVDMLSSPGPADRVRAARVCALLGWAVWRRIPDRTAVIARIARVGV
jgi:hypothetical protein